MKLCNWPDCDKQGIWKVDNSIYCSEHEELMK